MICVNLHDRRIDAHDIAALVKFFDPLFHVATSVIMVRTGKAKVERDVRIRIGVGILQVRRQSPAAYTELCREILKGWNVRTLAAVVQIAERYGTADGRFDIAKAEGDQEKAKARKILAGDIVNKSADELTYAQLVKLASKTSARSCHKAETRKQHAESLGVTNGN